MTEDLTAEDREHIEHHKAFEEEILTALCEHFEDHICRAESLLEMLGGVLDAMDDAAEVHHVINTMFSLALDRWARDMEMMAVAGSA